MIYFNFLTELHIMYPRKSTDQRSIDFFCFKHQINLIIHKVIMICQSTDRTSIFASEKHNDNRIFLFPKIPGRPFEIL